MIQIVGLSSRTWRRYILVILPVLLYLVVMWTSRPRQTSTPVAKARPHIQPALQRRSTEKKEAGQSAPTPLAPMPAAKTPAAKPPAAKPPAAKTPAAKTPAASSPATAMSAAPASKLTPAAPAPASTPVASMSVAPPTPKPLTPTVAPKPAAAPAPAASRSSAPPSAPTHSVLTTAPKPAPTPSGPTCHNGDNALRLATKSSESVACAKDAASNPTNKGKLKFPVTVVTGYYRIRSKRPATTYMRWLELFLHRIATPIAFYTNCDTLASVLPVVRDREQLFPGRTLADVLDLEETPLARRFGPVLRQQEARDGERFVGHNYLLYLVWLLKTEAIMASIRENRFCSEWFLWVDGGAFRGEHPLKNWPSPRRMDMIPKDRALYEVVFPFGNQANIKGLPKDGSLDKFLIDNRGTFYQNHLAGGFIGLNVRQGFHLKFYKLLTDMYQIFVDRDFMIVKDQSVFHALFLKQPELFALIQSNWKCGDGWFHALPWLADKTELNCLETAPLLLLP